MSRDKIIKSKSYIDESRLEIVVSFSKLSGKYI
jgi:hypothetical protein